MRNLAPMDRSIRVVIGLALVAYPALAGWATGWIAVLAVIGAFQLMTALTGY